MIIYDNIYCSSPQPCLFDNLTVINPMNQSDSLVFDALALIGSRRRQPGGAREAPSMNWRIPEVWGAEPTVSLKLTTKQLGIKNVQAGFAKLQCKLTRKPWSLANTEK